MAMTMHNLFCYFTTQNGYGVTGTVTDGHRHAGRIEALELTTSHGKREFLILPLPFSSFTSLLSLGRGAYSSHFYTGVATPTGI